MLVKITNYVDVSIPKIRSRERYDHNMAVILGTVESYKFCQTSVFCYSYQLPKHKGTCYFFSPFWSPHLCIFEEELKLLCSLATVEYQLKTMFAQHFFQVTGLIGL